MFPFFPLFKLFLLWITLSSSFPQLSSSLSEKTVAKNLYPAAGLLPVTEIPPSLQILPLQNISNGRALQTPHTAGHPAPLTVCSFLQILWTRVDLWLVPQQPTRYWHVATLDVHTCKKLAAENSSYEIIIFTNSSPASSTASLPASLYSHHIKFNNSKLDEELNQIENQFKNMSNFVSKIPLFE